MDDYQKILVGLTKVETLQETMHEDIKEIKADVKKQNGRVRKLEGWRWYVIGISTGITIVVAELFRILK